MEQNYSLSLYFKGLDLLMFYILATLPYKLHRWFFKTSLEHSRAWICVIPLVVKSYSVKCCSCFGRYIVVSVSMFHVFYSVILCMRYALISLVF
jgi:hypothetical protein